jgi:hypothetical protein
MNDHDFVVGIRNRVLSDNWNAYKGIFSRTTPESATDPYWREALRLYSRLDQNDRDVLLTVMRQVMVDTISNIFAVLDGAATFPGPREKITVDVSGQRIGGTLQDQFLELEQTESS